MAEFTLGSYAARSCPVKTFNDFDPTLQQPALDHSLRESFQGGEDQRKLVLASIVEQDSSVVDLRSLGTDHWAELEASTLGAMSDGADVVVGGVLPLDLAGHRSGRADVLVRGDDTPDGRPGYWPMRIKNYKVLERQVGCTDLQYSTIDDLGAMQVLPDLRYRAYRQAALLELAHVWRLLETAGFASATPLAGIVGTDKPHSPGEGPAVAWVRLDHRFLRTFSRTSPTGHRMRSALERYDHEHGFRVHVAEQAMRRTGVDDPEPVVRPIRVKECEWCAWWEVCRPRMDDDDLSLRISKTPLDVRELQTLMGLGIGTVAELAEADIEAILPQYLPLTAHRDHSEQRLRTAARRARMLAAGVELERVSSDPIAVPRSDVEIDLDIETAERDVTYLWGVLVTDRRSGEQYYEHFSAFADQSGDEEVQLAVRFARWLVDFVAAHPEALVFHYSDYETVHLRRLAERSNHPDLVAACGLVRDHFVDLFGHVRDNFVGVDGLGLKVVARKGAGFNWRDDDAGGLNSQTWFAASISAGTDAGRAAARTRVLEYNEDDVRATWAVREWLDGVDAGPPAGD
ncbi:TM0106 family RecB-like putative nuclease [Tessaracoccus rhinocerotis]|uniref:TM0106 family RecB-like putative nuclease n=1 Tax=Tessaracoccus rhinocerotis TaxID=1689449 RepID=A0A553K5J6_9ACTN|nr:TM0106 family RecB-like putative nuclease [Tessaracoccus rhinocerotis]TRY19984.1 TM0106 family RecB-like putative nuclease [Tessaracoccus rhinocerotis]